MIDTVRAGGDTDTNAAIAGALLGAVHGRGAIPHQWFDRKGYRRLTFMMLDADIVAASPSSVWFDPASAHHKIINLQAVQQRHESTLSRWTAISR